MKANVGMAASTITAPEGERDEAVAEKPRVGVQRPQPPVGEPRMSKLSSGHRSWAAMRAPTAIPTTVMIANCRATR